MAAKKQPKKKSLKRTKTPTVKEVWMGLSDGQLQAIMWIGAVLIFLVALYKIYN